MLIEEIMNAHECIAVVGLLSLSALRLIAGQGPLNTAVDIGTPKTYLNCSNSGVPSSQINWMVYEFSDYNIRTPRTIVNGCISIDRLFEVDFSTPNSCNLIILNAQSSQTGWYSCSPRGQPEMSAEFYVMETKAICSSRGNKINGYTFYCGVSFRGKRLSKFLDIFVDWYGESAITEPPAQRYYNGTHLSTIFSITSGVYKVPQNLCRINFGYKNNNLTTGQATNLPSYDSNCSVTEFSENKELTYITLSRNVGILAGRTRVIITITSEGIADDVGYVWFGDYTLGASVINSVKRTNMSCLILDIYSPPGRNIGNVSIIIRNLDRSATLYYDGFDWTDPTAYFEYRANPTITKLYPTTHLTSGGTRITIEGSNLDAVEASSLQMSVKIYRNDSVENITTTADCLGIIQDTYPAYNINKRLLCRMPTLDLPEDFLKFLEETVKKAGNPSIKRRKRSVNGNFEVARFTNKFGEVAAAELRLIMDGLPPVLIESFNVDFIPTSLISFNKAEDVVRIKSGNPENLELRGTYINKIDADNFVITIGNANCTTQSKRDNVILYLPPKDRPSNISGSNVTYCTNEMLDIQVSINQERHNNTQWFCGCAEYYEYYNTFPLLLVVLVTVLGGILIIVISVVVIIAYCTKCRKKPDKTNNSTEMTPPSVVLRNKPPARDGKNDNVNMRMPNGESLSNYKRTIPDDSINDSINYSRNVNNYNRTVPSIYP